MVQPPPVLQTWPVSCSGRRCRKAVVSPSLCLLQLTGCKFQHCFDHASHTVPHTSKFVGKNNLFCLSQLRVAAQACFVPPRKDFAWCTSGLARPRESCTFWKHALASHKSQHRPHAGASVMNLQWRAPKRPAHRPVARRAQAPHPRNQQPHLPEQHLKEVERAGMLRTPPNLPTFTFH